MAKLTAPQKKKLAELAKERRELRATITAAEKRQKEIDAILLEKLPEEDTTPLSADLGVYIAPNRRFSADTFAAAVPVIEHPELYKLVPDLDEIKKAYSPNQMAEFQNVSYTVRVVDL